MDRHTFERWLTAERDDLPQVADAAFGRLIGVVPKLRPSPGFADRVLAAAFSTVRPPVDLFVQAWARALVAACLVVGGVSVALLSPGAVLRQLLDLSGTGLTFAVRAGHAVGSWLGWGVSAWNWVADVDRALALALATPQAVALLVANLFVAAFAFFALNRLMSAEAHV